MIPWVLHNPETEGLITGSTSAAKNSGALLQKTLIMFALIGWGPYQKGLLNILNITI